MPCPYVFSPLPEGEGVGAHLRVRPGQTRGRPACLPLLEIYVTQYVGARHAVPLRVLPSPSGRGAGGEGYPAVRHHKQVSSRQRHR